ncbi:nickel pincer cofactor biosynthesis protein LarC [Spirochaetota bacterium]
MRSGGLPTSVYFDLQSGISGDMILSALIGAVGDNKKVMRLIKKIRLPSFKVKITHRMRSSVSTIHTDIIYDRNAHGKKRGLREIGSIITRSPIPQGAKDKALRVFKTLAAAEAKVHRKKSEEIHFHEIGAVDSIVDIVGSCILMEEMKISALNFGKLYFSSGCARIAHGTVPLPVPAVGLLCRGLSFETVDAGTELVTPTGAALLTVLGRQCNAVRGSMIKAVAVSGSKEIPGRPPYAQALVFQEEGVRTEGSSCTFGDAVDGIPIHRGENVIIETNLDDDTGENISFVMDTLLKQGALDVFITPIIMKKGRPAHTLTVLAQKEKTALLIRTILLETTTFGLRMYPVEKIEMHPLYKKIKTSLGEVTVKCIMNGSAVKYKFEFDEIKKIAQKRSASAREIQNILAKEIKKDMICKSKK